MTFRRCVVVALCALFSTNASAQAFVVIDVFVLAGMTESVVRTDDPSRLVNVHIIDRVDAIERTLSQGLPSEASSARAVLEHRLEQRRYSDSGELVAGWQGLSLAARYRIERVPAIVINAEAVIYGLTNIDRAIGVWQER